MYDICANCGSYIAEYNDAYPLWFGADERMCSICREKFDRFREESYPEPFTIEFIDQKNQELKKLGFTDNGIRHIKKFATIIEKEERKRAEELRIAAKKKEQQEENQKKNLVLEEKARQNWEDNSRYFIETTGFTIDGHRICEYIGIRSGEIVLGTGFLSEFSAGMSDLFGAKSEAMANKLTQAKEAALARLKENCLKVNANAVIGVDLDISIMGQNMILACANGTAVRIEKE